MADGHNIAGDKKNYNLAAVVLAGGRGSRMKSDVPKQYLLIKDKPVLYYSLMAFQKSSVDTICLVAGKDEIAYCKENIIEKYHLDKVKYIVEGGSERYNSVYNGLKAVKDSDYVLIHDGARPFLTQNVIDSNIKTVIAENACVTGVRSKDTVKIADTDGYVTMTPDRSSVWIIQTPQTFATSLIYEAYTKVLQQKSISVTDDAMVVETAFNTRVRLVTGDYRNIKITTPEDLKVALSFVEDFDEKH